MFFSEFKTHRSIPIQCGPAQSKLYYNEYELGQEDIY